MSDGHQHQHQRSVGEGLHRPGPRTANRSSICANMTEIQVDGPLPFPPATPASGDVINSLCNTK